MSDRSHNVQTEPMANADSFDLSELRGFRQPIQQLSDAAVNLCEASIPSNNIHRINSKEHQRAPSSSLKQVSARGLLPTRTLRALGTRKNRTQTGTRNGIFKNPYYRYHGGIFARILTFIANLLKVFEQLLLGGLRTAAVFKKLITPQPSQENTRATKEKLEKERLEKERLLKLEKKSKRLLIHRSQD
jgi:hypothetical protein